MDNSLIITEIKSRVISLVNKNKLIHQVVAVYIFGGYVEDFLENRKLSTNEIDLLFVVRRRLTPGDCPLDKKIFNSFCEGLKLNGKDTFLIFNGIPPFGYNGSVSLVDIIGDGLQNIEEREPNSFIFAYKPKILIFGSDVYERLVSEFFSLQGRKVVFEGMAKYVKKVFFERPDQYSKKAIAKNAIFGASLLMEQTTKTNAKRAIVNIISKGFPVLKNYLKIFEQTYYDPKNIDKPLLIECFNAFYSDVVKLMENKYDENAYR